jgi:hypothetical protein
MPRALVGIVKQLLYFERYVKDLAPDYELFTDPMIVQHLMEGWARR